MILFIWNRNCLLFILEIESNQSTHRCGLIHRLPNPNLSGSLMKEHYQGAQGIVVAFGGIQISLIKVTLGSNLIVVR